MIHKMVKPYSEYNVIIAICGFISHVLKQACKQLQKTFAVNIVCLRPVTNIVASYGLQ